jgi:hypothetical protein
MDSLVGQTLTPELLKAIEKRAMLNLLYSIKFGLKQTIPININEHFIDQEIRMIKEYGEPVRYLASGYLSN